MKPNPEPEDITSTNLLLHGKAGRKPNTIVRERLPLLLDELSLATPQRLRRRYQEKYGQKIGWNTVARHLNVLVDRGVVIQHVLATGRRRHTVVYELNRDR